MDNDRDETVISEEDFLEEILEKLKDIRSMEEQLNLHSFQFWGDQLRLEQQMMLAVAKRHIELEILSKR